VIARRRHQYVPRDHRVTIVRDPQGKPGRTLQDSGQPVPGVRVVVAQHNDNGREAGLQPRQDLLDRRQVTR
jgi:hypothetical protein